MSAGFGPPTSRLISASTIYLTRLWFRRQAPSTTSTSSATLRPYSAGSLVAVMGLNRRCSIGAALGRRASRSSRSHVLIGLPSPSCLDPAFYTAQVFSGLFGGGMSSRLFQEIREDRGLCYSIYSTVWGVKDTGMLAVHAATGPELVEELADVVAQELAAVAEEGPTDAELQRSKAQLKAGLLMALESSSVHASRWRDNSSHRAASSR